MHLRHFKQRLFKLPTPRGVAEAHVESSVPGRCTEQPPTNHLRCDGTELNLTTQGMVLIEKMVVQLNLPVHLDRNLLLFLPFPYLHSQIALIFLPFTRHALVWVVSISRHSLRSCRIMARRHLGSSPATSARDSSSGITSHRICAGPWVAAACSSERTASRLLTAHCLR